MKCWTWLSDIHFPFSAQKIGRMHTTQQQNKFDFFKREKEIGNFPKKTQTNGQQVHEKMLNITNH